MNEEPHLVIPAAGLGTRMRSVNPFLPKEMLPVLNKPAIQYAVEEGLSAGIKNIVIIINRNKEIIREYFEGRRAREKLYPLAAERMEEIAASCSFTFLYQEELTGEADAIGLSRHIVGKGPLAIIYPDNIYLPAPGALLALKAVYEQFGKDVCALMEVSEENAPGLSNSGRVDLAPFKDNIFRIDRIHPKGNGWFATRFREELRTCGIWIAGPHVFEYIERARNAVTTGEFTDWPVRNLMLEEKGLLGYRLPGRVFDIGNPGGYELCRKWAEKGLS
jgi:UTP--glucose-1-phosphate uridylyltransferase